MKGEARSSPDEGRSPVKPDMDVRHGDQTAVRTTGGAFASGMAIKPPSGRPAEHSPPACRSDRRPDDRLSIRLRHGDQTAVRTTGGAFQHYDPRPWVSSSPPSPASSYGSC